MDMRECIFWRLGWIELASREGGSGFGPEWKRVGSLPWEALLSA